MDEKPNLINKFHSLSSKKRMALLITPIVIIFTVLTTLLVINLLPKDYDRIKITNPELISQVPQHYIDEFKKMFLVLLESENYIDNNDTIPDITIREESVASFAEINNGNEYSTTSFLIDSDTLKQTFRISIVSTNAETTSPPISISCPKAPEAKYPNLDCRGIISESNNLSIRNYLPHELVSSSGKKILVKKITNNSAPQLEIYLYSCDEINPPIEEATNLVKEWVNEVGDNKKYKYNVRTGYCEGDAI